MNSFQSNSDLVITGYAGAICFLYISISKYWFDLHDLDRFIAYTTIGLLIAAISWLYNKYLENSNTLASIEDYLADKTIERRSKIKWKKQTKCH